MDIKKLTEADYDNLVELYMELDELHVCARPDCFIHRDKEKVYPRDAFIHNLTYPGGIELGAFEDGKLIGFVQATLWEKSGMVKDLKTVYLDNIYILPAYRRRGIATNLFAEVERWAKEQGAIRLDLQTWDFNKSAIALYEAMGMIPQRHVFEKKLK